MQNLKDNLSNKLFQSIKTKLFLVAIIISGLVYADISLAVPDKRSQDFPAAEVKNHRESIEVTIEKETSVNEDLKTKLIQAASYHKVLKAELNVYNVQLSAYGNILLQSQTPVSDLEKARIDTLKAKDALDLRLKELSEINEFFTQLSNQTQEQLVLNEKQLSDINASGQVDALTGNLKKNLKTLITILTAKQKNIEKIFEIYKPLQKQMEEIRTALLEVAEKLNRLIETRKKEALFQRSASPLLALNIQLIGQELSLIFDKLAKLASVHFWAAGAASFWEAAGQGILTALVLYAVFLWAIISFRRFCRNYEKTSQFDKTPWRGLVFMIFYKTIIVLGTTVFIYVYMYQQAESAMMVLWKMALDFLLLWLFTQLGLSSLQAWNKSPLPAISPAISKRICLGLRIIRYFGIFYLVLGVLLENAGGILLIMRMLFGIGLFAGYVYFWKSIKPHFSELSDKINSIKPLMAGAGYFIFGLAPVLELIGYGHLSLYWLTSWGITLAACLLGAILMMAIREWQHHLKNNYQPEAEKLTKDSYTMQWLFMLLSWVLWAPMIIVSVLMAWGGKDVVFIGFFRVMTYPLPIGDMQLSLIGFVFSALILLITHASARLWRRFLRRKILIGSRMDIGLKDSITTISVYLLWVVGIFISLRAVGVSSTSLTVIFGALSIGLGFGLQNIFNNFVSGIILLFERPIQVGDAVEISGTWGVVKKINVRSTLVQTYDNASLIIPNSEFISNKVVNWSFKDHRIRRVITVGVAYGSDTSLVSRTLLEIAGENPGVLDEPAPEVLFSDFGDSALIFKLRIWTIVDSMVSVETQIRFEIERLFRERHILIPFPQRDIHIL